MNVHTDVVPYCWTEVDRLAEAMRVIPGLYVTPYRIPRGALGGAAGHRAGQLVHVPLGASDNAAVVGRFFRAGYEWVAVPDGVDPTGLTMQGLFEALFALDPVRFAHLDPALVMALAARRAAETLPGGPAIRAVDPMLAPYADLAQLHFDYWGNTRLRGRVIAAAIAPTTLDLGAGIALDLPWFGGDPLAGMLPVLLPSATPAEREGVKVERVLARAATRGADLRAVPRRLGGGVRTTLRVGSLEPPRIELDGWQPQRLEPLRPGEWRLGASRVRFLVTTTSPSLEVRFEVLRGEAVYYGEVHAEGELLAPGVHVVTWDGRDLQGVWDSAVLKENDLSARLTVVDAAGRIRVATAALHTAPSTVRWVDARIDPAARAVTVHTYARYRSPSELELFSVDVGLPALPGGTVASYLGEAARRLPVLPWPSLPGAAGAALAAVGAPAAIVGDRVRLRVNFPPLLDLDENTYQTLKGLTIEGIHQHWSRVGERAVAIDGEAYDLEVHGRERAHDAVNTFLCRTLPEALGRIGVGDGTVDSGDLGTRPFNACLAEGWPIVIFWSEGFRIGYLRRSGAHEIGHTVLREYQNIFVSMTHKGTSDFGLDQQPIAAARTRSEEAAEAPHEVDLMHYHHAEARNGDETEEEIEAEEARLDALTFATEDDARGLVTLASVMFG